MSLSVINQLFITPINTKQNCCRLLLGKMKIYCTNTAHGRKLCRLEVIMAHINEKDNKEKVMKSECDCLIAAQHSMQREDGHLQMYVVMVQIAGELSRQAVLF